MLFAVESRRVKVAVKLLAEVDVLITNFTLADRVSHFYWQELDDESPFAKEETAIFKAYQLLDKTVGSVKQKLPHDSHLLIFSKIGFGPLLEYVRINDYLKDAAFLAYTDQGSIRWQKTVAFEAVQGSHGININDNERYENGRVSWADYPKIRNDLIEYVKTIVNPRTGLPLFNKVICRQLGHTWRDRIFAPAVAMR